LHRVWQLTDSEQSDSKFNRPQIRQLKFVQDDAQRIGMHFQPPVGVVDLRGRASESVDRRAKRTP
jgi:hypothetical protein